MGEVKIQMVDTLTQYSHIKEEVDQAVLEVIRSGMFIGGPVVNRFKENLAQYLGSGQVIPCANGTDALQVALMAAGLQPGDEVITPAFTYFATAEVVALLGLKPVFADVDPLSFNIDIQQIESLIGPKTRCILPVHLFGQCADMEPILRLAEKYNLVVIEDAAQAIGSEYTLADGTVKKAGTIGHIGCTSFYPSKNLGAYGDGGAIFTNDEALGKKIQMICNHGISTNRYIHDVIGVNSRLDAIQAAILDIKLTHLETYNAARRNAADMYDQAFKLVSGIDIPFRSSFTKHVFHQYTLKIKGGRALRDQLKANLDATGIPSMIYYPVPLHLQPAYKNFGYAEGMFPVSEQLSAEVISLPMHSELTEQQIAKITAQFIDCYTSAQNQI
jgi:dTDP-4-amino-4,6-dideoxygalactose transaminase